MSNPFGHTYNVKAKINLDGQEVLPGMVAKIHLNIESLTGIVVPVSCIQTVADGMAVWVVRNGKSYRQIIQTSDFVKNGALISQGLNYGDTIVTVGYQKLYNGAKISFK